MCPQIFDYRSIAPSSGDFCGSEIFKNKFLVNGLLDPFRGRGWSVTRGSLRDFFISCPPYVKADEAGGSTTKNLKPIFETLRRLNVNKFNYVLGFKGVIRGHCFGSLNQRNVLKYKSLRINIL